MRKRVIQLCYGIIFACLLLASATLQAAASIPAQKQSDVANTTDFPTVDPNYVYNQLAYMVTTFQHREAGYRASAVGHDGFANYWAQEMVRDLAGLGPQVRRDPFSINGWLGRPADAQAFNVEVSVPGAVHPEQVVVIGCHYDGMAISTQSANDDASGCAIELGVARAMGNYWRSHHSYPARTLRFVIFDAEEQGIFGSFHYLDSTINGDTRNIVAMFNEEQNGIAYPLRYLGRLTNPLLPFSIYLTPLNNTDLYPEQERLSPTQRANIVNFRALMQQAVPAVFREFLAAGYQTLTYHGNHNQDVAQPIFTPDQLSNVTQLDDHLGGSDQIAFTLAGVPSATFAGNSTYYENNPPAWSYPYDQRQDTIQLMNTFAQGGSRKSNALALALALPGTITAWMLNQPSILGQSAASGQSSELPIAAISDIGQTRVGQKLTLDAR
ncbi:MAG TPA: M28 family peptidase, partial [Ktedonobacteraceae bacterium]|nr:M28 family peptidase [Ktedonobacteraceae bacterium]